MKGRVGAPAFTKPGLGGVGKARMALDAAGQQFVNGVERAAVVFILADIDGGENEVLGKVLQGGHGGGIGATLAGLGEEGLAGVSHAPTP